ncbi:MAG: hypothetical protein EAZ57_02080 [Cytophagales bacterium]|nr:MAG: hypothetical protein EAZ67_02505 [Cytophagales bacterium]TAF61910.1 MAG: hypothetical protein EAZ57_02080 [Cytophagales bacterium]
MKAFLRNLAQKFTQSRFLQTLHLVNVAVSKASFNRQRCQPKDHLPRTWEYSGFSQNGEDGIIEFLHDRLSEKNHFFIEIGASDGTENNTSLLAICKRFAGIMIEGSMERHLLCQRVLHAMDNPFVLCKQAYVGTENLADLLKDCPYKEPDVFSLDIDSNDYYVAEKLFDLGFLPKIFVVEYNASFGDSLPLTIPYTSNFNLAKAHSSLVYFGASLAAWKHLFEKKGYVFITTEASGSNAFFVQPKYFEADFLAKIEGVPFTDNRAQAFWLKKDWSSRFELMKSMPFRDVTKA